MTATIRCSIWKTIQLENFKAIIRCPEFQRLRSLKQLGFVHILYPGAIHSRYEHSLGTAHLCKVLLECLEHNSNRVISPFHKKCVIAAGLLHDLGHGPFSHAWERISSGKHEEMSVQLAEKILSERDPDFFEEPDRDLGIDLVKSLIMGDASRLSNDEKYLAEIVSNKYCELDVDKWDYILRDMYYLRNVEGVVPIETEYFDFFKRAKIVYDDEGVSHIAYPEEDVPLVRAFFKTRRQLRKQVYLNPQVEYAEEKFCDLLKKADSQGFLFNGLRIEAATEDISAFLLLTDAIENHLQIWMENHRDELPSLYHEYVTFKSHINQATDYLMTHEHDEATQKKSPLFFSSESLHRISLSY